MSNKNDLFKSLTSMFSFFSNKEVEEPVCGFCAAGVKCSKHSKEDKEILDELTSDGIEKVNAATSVLEKRLADEESKKAKLTGDIETLGRLTQAQTNSEARLRKAVRNVVHTERQVAKLLGAKEALQKRVTNKDAELVAFAAIPAEDLLSSARKLIPEEESVDKGVDDLIAKLLGNTGGVTTSATSTPTGKEEGVDGDVGKGVKPESKKPVVVAQLVAAGFSETQAEFICNKSRGGQKVVDSYVDYLNTTEDGNRAGEVARIAVIMCGDPGFYQNLWRKWLPKAAPTTPSGGRRNPDVSTASSGVGGTEIPDPDFSTPEVPSKEAGQRLRGGQPTSTVPSGDGVDFVGV